MLGKGLRVIELKSSENRPHRESCWRKYSNKKNSMGDELIPILGHTALGARATYTVWEVRGAKQTAH